MDKNQSILIFYLSLLNDSGISLFEFILTILIWSNSLVKGVVSWCYSYFSKVVAKGLIAALFYLAKQLSVLLLDILSVIIFWARLFFPSTELTKFTISCSYFCSKCLSLIFFVLIYLCLSLYSIFCISF